MALLAGRYRLLSQLGQGGMGTVWRAMDELLQQEVAVKEVRLPPDLDEASRTELTERTLREARAAATLRSNPSIVTVHDVVLDGERPWIVMELVRGRSLDQVVRDDGPLPPQRVAAIGVRMLDALAAAHASGILHRDVKPGNVLLTDDGRVLLTDFGIATIAGDSALTQTGLLAGSPGYIAPERLRGEVDGPLADLWSLGATLFTAVEGGPPFARTNEAAVLAAVLMQEPAPFRLAGPLAPVLAAVLEKDPARRCSPEEVAGWLEAIARGAPTTGPALRQERTQPRRLPRRRRTQVVLGAVLAVVLIVAAGVAVVPYLFPNVVRLIGYALVPPPTYTVKPPTLHIPSPSATPLIGDDFEACDLLTSAQTRSLFGTSMKRQFFLAQSCSWNGADATSLHVSVTRMPADSYATQFYDSMVDFMKDEPRRTPGTKVRKGPDVGDEAFSYTRRMRFMTYLYQTKIVYRYLNVSVVIDVTARKPGYAIADRAAKLVAAALNKYRRPR
ncbi:serine/threonine-protein kinase [Nonomuraea sp. NPDC000554]|uniref:serine/threonine-protein kinase n=1 Tax=Nonomuraea sp. NPDC000554 TaxID=3154259 RepID=UPI00332B9880